MCVIIVGMPLSIDGYACLFLLIRCVVDLSDITKHPTKHPTLLNIQLFTPSEKIATHAWLYYL